MEDTLILSTIGLSDKDQAVLKSLFSLVSDDLAKPWRIAEDLNADVTLVDVDDENGRSVWEKLAAEPHRKCAALTRNRTFSAPFLLRKPLRSKDILELLNDYAVASHGPAEDGAWRSLVLSHKQDHYTLAEHLRRRSWNQPVLLRRIGAPDLIIDVGSGSWYSEAPLARLTVYFHDQFAAEEAYPLSHRQLLEVTSGLPRNPLIDLQWQSALQLGGGQLHPDLTPDRRVGLLRLPPQAREDAEHLRLAEQLTTGPHTPRQLAAECEVVSDEIARFLNACLYCGWLIIDRTAQAPVPAH